MPGTSVLAAAEGGWEPGDRLPAAFGPGGASIFIEEFLLAGVPAPETLVDGDGRALDVSFDSAESAFRGPGLGRLATTGPGDLSGLWLEYLSPGAYRLVVEGPPEPTNGEGLRTEHGLPVQVDGTDLELLRRGGRSGETPAAELELALRAARLATQAGFDQLLCLPMVRDMDLLEHQVRTARTVLRRLHGRALLCDEVGLGKTIEAGLILSELHVRGLARSVLVLVPPSLIEQWQGELRRKFALEFVSHDAPEFRQRGPAAWGEHERVIASIHTAKREPHRSAILAREWDLVIIDEAHHFRNRATQLWRLASELRKQFILLLTATPVQNDLEELFNLVTLLEPGLLSTSRQFQRRFVDRRDKLTPRNVPELHQLLSEVMVRNRRSTVGLQFTRRWARTEQVTLLPDEQELYASATRFARARLRSKESKAGLSRMALLALQMAVGSSSAAAAGTLERLAEQGELPLSDRSFLAERAAYARRLNQSAKAERLLRLLVEFGDKMVVFTQFRATQEMLAARLGQAGLETAVFHGGLSRLEKEAAVEEFRGPARVLLATESGSEGRNLQFAHAVCNFDLPWNPMKIEQRIGRLSRIGQTRDVYVFNLVAAGTVEAAVLHLLEAKLHLFELVIGEVDMILGNLEEDREFQDVVADLWLESASSDEFVRRMEELGDRLVAAKEAYFQQRGLDDRLFADQFAPDPQ